MRSRRAIWTFFSSFAIAPLRSGVCFKPNLPPMKDAQVLVVGASGQVGEQVCLRLSKQGFKVRAMVRNVDDFFPRKSDLGNGPIEVVLGDVLDKSSLMVAMEDCQSCISCQGTSRLAQPRDLWTHPKKDPAKTHPYYVNYVGTKNIIEAAQESGVKRLVRITGLSVGLPAFSPFAYLLNLLASMAVKWQYESEKAMREAAEIGLAYTVVRPGSFTDKARPPDACLMLESDGKPTSLLKSKPMYTISRKDVADLLVLAMQSKNAAGATLSCSWGKNKNGPKTWKSLMAEVKPDTSPLPKKYYRLSMACLGSLSTAFALAVGAKVAAIVNFMAERQRQSQLYSQR